MTSTGERGSRRRWRPAVAAIALAAAGMAPVLTGAAGASAAWQAPGYERTIGGTGTAGVYAWGIAYDAIAIR